MFETSIAKTNQGRRPKSLRYLPLAVGLHGFVLLGILAAQVWTVDVVADPPQFATYRVTLPPPEPPAGGRKPVAKPDTKPVPATPAPVPTQPEQVPEETVVSTDLPATPSTGEDTVESECIGDCEGEGPGPFDGPGTEPAPAPPEPDLSVPVELTGDMVAPVVIHRIDPKYTPIAIAARKTGTVVVQATITRDGNVVDVKVMKSIGFGLDEAAVNAVRQWKFKPAERFGRPAAVLYNLTVKFNLR